MIDINFYKLRKTITNEIDEMFILLIIFCYFAIEHHTVFHLSPLNNTVDKIIASKL